MTQQESTIRNLTDRELVQHALIVGYGDPLVTELALRLEAALDTNEEADE